MFVIIASVLDGDILCVLLFLFFLLSQKFINIAYIYYPLILIFLGMYNIQCLVVESHHIPIQQAKCDTKAGIILHNNKKKDMGIPKFWRFKQDQLNQIDRTIK